MLRVIATLLLLRRPLWALLRPLFVLGGAIAAAGALRRLLQQPSQLAGQAVFITGGSRGLGLLLAHEFAMQGCRVAICARDGDELERAAAKLRRAGAEVLPFRCDVADRAEIQRAIDRATNELGAIDILVNNAGVIDVGALSVHDEASFQTAMDVMFWGPLYATNAVLPQMRARRSGRIANITSIGGKASVPHLQPYAAAKFAAVGFSEGLRAELAGTGITVTTIVPGLMRTGSFLNAYFRGQWQKEFAWFGLGAALPFISMDARRAARQIVDAVRRGEAERTLGLPAVILARLQGAAPGLTADLLGLARRLLLPEAGPRAKARARGWDVQQSMPAERRRLLQALTALGQDAARRFNQLAPEESRV